MNEKPLKKLTINNAASQFNQTILNNIFLSLFALTFVIVPLVTIQAPNNFIKFGLVILPAVMVFVAVRYIFWVVSYAGATNICYVSDILIKNDSFDIVYNKGLKIVNVQNIKISDIKDIKLEVDFTGAFIPGGNNFDTIKFFVSIYPKDGTEVIKFSSGYYLLNEEISISTNFICLLDIIKYFNTFDFFHLEFLKPAVCTKVETEVF